MSAATTGQPAFMNARHLPRKPSTKINLRMGEAICKLCDQRKTRKGGTTLGGRFYCAECKGKV